MTEWGVEHRHFCCHRWGREETDFGQMLVTYTCERCGRMKRAVILATPDGMYSYPVPKSKSAIWWWSQ